MTCGARMCRTERYDPDPDDDLGICFECSMRIARRFKYYILREESERRDRADEARRQAAEVRSPSPSIPDMYAAYEQPAGTSFVYYVRIHNHIKIGYSTRVLGRLSALRVPVSDLLALEPGGRRLESQRHGQFDHLRITRRWENFRSEEDLLAHIDSVVAEFGLPKWLQSPRRGKNGPIEIRWAG